MSRTVTVGERTFTVHAFNARKATLVGRALKRVAEKVPDLQQRVAQFSRDYAENNATLIPRELAHAPAYEQHRELLAGVTDADWDRCDGVLKVPAPDPTDNEQIAAIFPVVYDLAERDVLDLLALVTTPNGRLKDAVREGDEDGAKLIAEAREDLLDDADPGALIELAAAAIEQIRAEFLGKAGVLQQIRAAFTPPLGSERTPPEETTTSPSSTGSPPPTAGTTGPPSTTSPTGPSPASVG